MGPLSFVAAVLLAAQSAPVLTAEVKPPPAPVPLGNPGSWVTQMDYPAAALRAEAQGTVRFVLDVDESGRVTGCNIAESSSNAELDAVTCAILQRRARFTPAKDAGGSPVAGKWSSAVRWMIPKDIPHPFVPAELVVSWIIEPDGSTSDCRVERKTGTWPEIDFCAPIARQKYVPLLGKDGKPTAKRVRQSVGRVIE